jgi:single-strand DNA-binding protein
MSVRSLNKVLLIGNLTRDPEIRYTAGGAAVASFGLATNRSWKNAEGNVQESTEFHNVVAWGKMAEICQQILAKGMKIYVEGSINTRSWEDESGTTKYRTEIRVNDMILLDSKGKQGVGNNGADVDASAPANDSFEEVKFEEEAPKAAASDTENADPLEDDLPF